MYFCGINLIVEMAGTKKRNDVRLNDIPDAVFKQMSDSAKNNVRTHREEIIYAISIYYADSKFRKHIKRTKI